FGVTGGTGLSQSFGSHQYPLEAQPLKSRQFGPEVFIAPSPPARTMMPSNSALRATSTEALNEQSK
ncbi:hypothetical protein DXG01_016035, partial [Tephrocybe rancida]